jgi:putative ABC transport system permease protein
VNRAFDKSASAFGTDVMYVEKWPWVSNDDWSLVRNRRDLKLDFANVIDRQASLVDAVAPVMISFSRKRVAYGTNSTENVLVTGTTSDYIYASGNTEIEGRFFSPDESAGGRPVCAIGASIAENLFPRGDAIGKTIRVSGFPYTVLGVFDKQGGLFGQFTSDTRVYIPISAFQSQFGYKQYVTINLRVIDKRNMEDAKMEVEGIMRKLRGLPPGKPNDFSINQQEILTETFGPISLTIASIGLFITGLSLFVGGIGIMNIMFVSVTERTKEIGIRKAIGAKRRTILLQFLVEAAALCLIGGLLGLAIAFPLSLIVNQFLPTAMPFSVVFIAIGISLAVGLISGFLPAYRAARMDPVEALRYE